MSAPAPARPVLAFPALAGMAYPRLDRLELVRVVPGPDAIPQLPAAERAGIRVLMTSATRGCDAAVIEALPDLALVVSQGAGQERLALDVLAARGIAVRSVGEALADDVADLAMTLTVMLCRDLPRADAFARDGAWRKNRFPLGTSLVGLRIGIGGLSGRIGRAIAARATVSRMIVAGLDRPSNRALASSLHPDWESLAAASDVLVMATPGSAELRHAIGARELRALGPQGRLVNVGRGSLVDTAALVEALEGGLIAGAALDVLDEEPGVPDRLAARPDVILTPHLGAQTWGQRQRSAAIAEDAVMALLRPGDGV